MKDHKEILADMIEGMESFAQDGRKILMELKEAEGREAFMRERQKFLLNSLYGSMRLVPPCGYLPCGPVVMTYPIKKLRVGQVVDFQLTSGEKAQFMVQRVDEDGYLCMLVDCLPKAYPMNKDNTNKGGYAASDLRKKMTGEILSLFPAGLRSHMVPFANGDLLRLPTEKEIFGYNKYGKAEPESVQQFEPMKSRRNRIAFRGEDEAWEWHWLENEVEDSAATFADVGSGGLAASGSAGYSAGVRPAFKIRNL